VLATSVGASSLAFAGQGIEFQCMSSGPCEYSPVVWTNSKVLVPLSPVCCAALLLG
jgi:hypothetical protein